MIISGLQTGNTRWLARHLQNTADNETIELAEVSGTVATDIDGALTEMDALCAGTRAKEGVYAAFQGLRKPPEAALDAITPLIAAGLAGLQQPFISGRFSSAEI